MIKEVVLYMWIAAFAFFMFFMVMDFRDILKKDVIFSPWHPRAVVASAVVCVLAVVYIIL